MVPDCNPDLHLKESALPVMSRNVVPWVVIFFALLLLCIALGSLAYCKKTLYKYWTIISAQILVKVALIPGVNVKVVHKGDVEVPNQEKPRSGDEYVCLEVQGQLFLVHYMLAPAIFALGCLFAFAYVGVFLTEQWKLTSNCNRLDPLLMGEKICFNYPCPNRIDCDAWNEAGKRETLLCWSLSINVFEVLTKFVVLAVFQVAIMHFLGLFIHRGCPCDCSGEKVWKQYLMITAFYLTFVLILLVILVVLIVVGLNSDALPDILVNFILPFAHVFMVAVAEVFALGIFVYMLCRGPLVKTVTSRDSSATLALQQDSDTNELISSNN